MKMKKDIKNLVMVILTIIAVICSVGSAMALSGSGTSGDPFIISDCVDLQSMEDNVTDNLYYELGNDIDCSDTINWNGGAGFETIGNWNIGDGYWVGHFDGKGYTISDLYINDSAGQTDGFGLFGTIGDYGSTYGHVKNLRLDNFEIRTSDGSIGTLGAMCAPCNVSDIAITNAYLYGEEYIGMAIGLLDNADFINLVDNVTVHGSIFTDTSKGYVFSSKFGGFSAEIQGSTVTNCHVDLDFDGINGAHRYVGGFAGVAYTSGGKTKIENCSARGTIDLDTTVASTDAEGVGGFFGYLAGAYFSGNYVKNSFSEVNITTNYDYVGGFYGGSDLGLGDGGFNFSNVYSTGFVIGEDQVGGFIGRSYSSGSEISYAYATGQVTGITNVGGFTGGSATGTTNECYFDKDTTGQTTTAGSCVGKTTTEMKTVSTWSAFDTSIWDINVGFYPAFYYTVPVIYQPCVEDWVQLNYNDSCMINDTLNEIIDYYDANMCGTFDDLPSDDGDIATVHVCNYCSEDIDGAFYTAFGECTAPELLQYRTKYYIDNNFDTCCDVTSISTDCSILADPYLNETESQSCTGGYSNEDLKSVFIDFIGTVGVTVVTYTDLIIVGLVLLAIFGIGSVVYVKFARK